MPSNYPPFRDSESQLAIAAASAQKRTRHLNRSISPALPASPPSVCAAQPRGREAHRGGSITPYIPSPRQSHLLLILVDAVPQRHPVLVLGICSEAVKVASVLPILGTHLGDSGTYHGFLLKGSPATRYLKAEIPSLCCPGHPMAEDPRPFHDEEDSVSSRLSLSQEKQHLILKT
jgi:hypothetical protein